MRSRLLGIALATALATSLAVPAAAQPRNGGFGHQGGFGRFGAAGRGGGMGQGFAGRFRARFDTANSTHDGHLTRDQARSSMPFIARHFDEIDSDHKGYITLDDIRGFRQKILARRQAAQGGDPDLGGPPP